jgi:PIN domain nuclease of toxin-antitoxin system
VRAVLDASAVLAAVLGEAGRERVVATIDGAGLCVVNLSEAVAKLIDKGRTEQEALTDLEGFLPLAVPFDLAQAVDAGFLRDATRGRGLSLGDRACLALARRAGARVLTADRGWATLDVGVEIEVIR